jgi:hypothetical protein
MSHQRPHMPERCAEDRLGAYHSGKSLRSKISRSAAISLTEHEGRIDPGKGLAAVQLCWLWIHARATRATRRLVAASTFHITCTSPSLLSISHRSKAHVALEIIECRFVMYNRSE